MSLSYSMYLAAPIPRSLQQALVVGDRATAGAAAPTYYGRPIVQLPHPLTREMVEDSYGFRPSVVVVYPLNKHLDAKAMEFGAIEQMSSVLRSGISDAYVNYAGLRTAMLRRRESVTVDDKWLHERPWLKSMLRDLLGTEYEVSDIPVPA